MSSLSLVRYKTNDYSVPTTYGHREVLIKAYVDRIEIHCGTECIAKHRRSYAKEDFIFDPLHYLALLEREKSRPWIKLPHLLAGNCLNAFQPYDGRLKAAWAPQASGSMFRYCG